MTANSVDQVKAQTLARYTEQGPGHINCAQAMVDFTMGILGRDQGIITVARYLGGGIGGMGGTCGAITGTAVALGLRDHYTAAGDPELVPSTQAALKELIRAFEQEFGASTCRQLTGHDMSTPEGMEAFRASEAHDRCPIYVAWMCDRLLPLLVGTPELEQGDADARAGDVPS
jgi:C_GCAxxG_C_C family probable redox protein